jgi:hypothetical protein
MLTARIAARPPLARGALHVEAYRERDGSWRARICRIPDRAAIAADHLAPAAPDCAVAGELRLSRWPALDAPTPLALRLTARFADGTLVEVAP